MLSFSERAFFCLWNVGVRCIWVSYMQIQRMKKNEEFTNPITKAEFEFIYWSLLVEQMRPNQWTERTGFWIKGSWFCTRSPKIRLVLLWLNLNILLFELLKRNVSGEKTISPRLSKVTFVKKVQWDHHTKFGTEKCITTAVGRYSSLTLLIM